MTLTFLKASCSGSNTFGAFIFRFGRFLSSRCEASVELLRMYNAESLGYYFLFLYTLLRDE